MSQFTVERHQPEGDAREQYMVTEWEGKHIVERFVVIGDEQHANGVVQQRRDSAKRMPIHYRPLGIV